MTIINNGLLMGVDLKPTAHELGEYTGAKFCVVTKVKSTPTM